MSCINIDIRMMNEPLILSTERIGGIFTSVSLVGEPLKISILDAILHPKVRCSIVCSIKELKNYLKVSPEDVQWITPEYGILYTVESDMDWIIVTN